MLIRQQRMAGTNYKEKSRQLKMPALQKSTCWQPGMTGCDVHCGVLTLWSVDAGSKHFSFGQICSSSPAGSGRKKKENPAGRKKKENPAGRKKEENLTGEAKKNLFKGFKLGQHQL